MKLFSGGSANLSMTLQLSLLYKKIFIVVLSNEQSPKNVYISVSLAAIPENLLPQAIHYCKIQLFLFYFSSYLAIIKKNLHVLKDTYISPNKRYDASAQDIAEGTGVIHRTVTSEDVEDYSTHVPGDVVNLIKQDDMKYRKRVLTSASGTTTVKILPKVFEKHQL